MLSAAPQRMAEVSLGPGCGWSVSEVAGARVSFKGYVTTDMRTLEGEDAALHVARSLTGRQGDDQLTKALAALAGHFAFVIETGDRVIASVDRCRSIPLLYGKRAGKVLIDDRGRRLRDALGLSKGDLDPEQVLACATSGYSIGAKTLYRGQHLLQPGEMLVADQEGGRVLSWFCYDAWNTEDLPQAEQALSSLHRRLMERLAASANGRPIAVPLSAGLDSRFIAAGLREVGYRDVRLFSYGRAGNHEAETARAVAERLGYPWTFVAMTTASQRAMFADPEHERDLWQEADTCACVPFEQDWSAIKALKDAGWLPKDAVIVNGQSGDFITGHHIPDQLCEQAADREGGRETLYASYFRKHHVLWSGLASGDMRQHLEPLLDAELRHAGVSIDDGHALAGLYEYLEYNNRQIKYVISGQRSYEALGFSWRLPLWDDDYILFWRRVPVALKAHQNLYRRVLLQDDWAGVWRDVPVNAKTIRPRWIIPPRLMAKAAFAPFGKARWHAAERRLFGWWMDSLRTSAVIPYRKALMDQRGPRHAVAWLVERYLAQHGIALDPLFESQAAPVRNTA